MYHGGRAKGGFKLLETGFDAVDALPKDAKIFVVVVDPRLIVLTMPFEHVRNMLELHPFWVRVLDS